MKLKVLLAKDLPSKESLPDNWPVLCEEVPDDYVVNAPTLLMSTVELSAQKSKYQVEYDRWKSSKDAVEDKVKDDKITSHDDCKKSALAKLSAIGLSQDELKVLFP